MSPQITYDRKPVPALCPKCGTARLHRSRSTSRTEELRKKYSSKRPFRCQECGWRGWIDEAHLRYPMRVPGMKKLKVTGRDVPVPDFDLDSSARSQNQPGVPESGAATDMPSAGGEPAAAGTVSRVEAPESSAGSVSDPGPSSKDSEGEDAKFISSITRDNPRPFTREVPENFHRHAHNKASACPMCGEYALYRSHTRGWGELLRKRFTSKRPYRCHKCSWRGWIQRGF
jgi:predicted RNA-binding Zn-ribbon protein involved in translation (DUF1610 family)